MYSVPLYNCLKLLADQFHPSIPKQFMIHRFLLLLLEATSCAAVPVASRGDFGPDPPFVSHPAVSSVSTAGLAPLPAPVFSMQKLSTWSPM